MLLKYNFFYILLYTLKFSNAAQCNENPTKSVSLKIKNHILCDYDKTIRPEIDNSETSIEIKFLLHHFNFEEYSNELEVAAWFPMKWVDEHLHWNPEDFENVEHIILSVNDIWKPDLSIYNKGPYGSSRIIQDEDQCLVFYYKKVICIALSRLTSACSPDFRFWPFDVQNCTIKIGSWYHTGEEIRVKDIEFLNEFSYFVENSEWHLDSVTVIGHPGAFNFSNTTFPTWRINFVIRRNASYKFAVIIVPYIVLILMSILTIWLDPTSLDRIYIIVINIPLHIMFLLNSVWEIEESGETVPYLILLLRNSLVIVSLSLIETITIRQILFKTEESPKFLVSFFAALTNNKIGQLLLFSELNPENAVENLTSDDSSNLVEQDRPKEWYLLGRLVDRLCFVLMILIYLGMFITCIPK